MNQLINRARAAPRLTGFATARPPVVLRQDDARRETLRLFAPMHGVERYISVFDHSGVEERQLVMPLGAIVARTSTAERNADYIEHASMLLIAAARGALARARTRADEITHVLLVSSTGLANPTLDVRIAPELGLSSGVVRMPLWGLGCGGGAQALSMAADLARGGARVLLILVELCSLTFVPGDHTPGNLVAAALFGDGAAAAVVEPASIAGARPGIAIIDHKSRRIDGTLQVMGWKISADGWRVVFSPEIPALVREHAPAITNELLARNEIDFAAIERHVLHPGGPAILDAYGDVLRLDAEPLEPSRTALRSHGNCSSVSIFHALESGDAGKGPVLFSAFGPGFTAEVLLGLPI